MKPQESARYSFQQVSILRRLVAQGEGARLEFKQKASDPRKISREIVALANTFGGMLLVGVGDDGSIPGLKYPEGESHVVQEALKQIHPNLPLRETFIPLGGSRTVLQYEIPESKIKPHWVVSDQKTRDYFVRVADKSILASRELREIIKRRQRREDIRFRYGDHEKLLMRYLEKNSSITLTEFVRLSGMKRFYASHKFVLLVLANVLRIIPSEKGDNYKLAF